MSDLTRLIDLLAAHTGTVSERRALLREALGARSPLMNDIAWEGAPREFLINMLAVLARDANAIDALLDVAKDHVGVDVSAQIETLRPALHQWAESGADKHILGVVQAVKRSVFISYARLDGREFAAELRTELASAFTVWQDVVALQGGEDWWQQIKAAIEAVDTLILVITERALLSHIVRREWVYARRLGKAIVPVVRDASLLTGAPRWLQRSHVYILDPTYPDYPQLHQRFIAQLRDPKPQPPVLNQTPPLPDSFVARPKLQDVILDHLIGAKRDDPQIGVTTLLGAGGFGKTTLAQAIGGDPDITDAFSGGVYYLTVGESEQMLTQGLNAILRDLKLPEAPADQAAAKVREALADRECLLILDDVWKTGTINLLHSLPQGHVLITTRQPEVAALSTGSPIVIAEMEPREASAVLTKYLPRDLVPTKDEERNLLRLAERLGEWALLLNIFGGTLRQQVSVSKRTLAAALEYVNRGLDSQGLHVFGRDDAGRNAALDASMSVSLRDFSEAERTRLYELAVFPDDVVIPESAALALWRGTAQMDEFAAQQL